MNREGGAGIIRGHRPSLVLLIALVITVAISPRIPIGSGAVGGDVRVQDILLLVAVVHLAIVPSATPRAPMLRLFGPLLPAFILGALLVTLMVCLVYPEVPLLARVAFAGRTIELFVLAAVIAALAVRVGASGMRIALMAILVGAGMNIAWVGFQLATGSTGTILGSEVGAAVDSYGPKLIGEPSSFGTGQYFYFVAAVAVAHLWVGSGRRVPFALLYLAAFGCAVAAQSRISMAAILVLGAVAIALSVHRGRAKLFSWLLAIVACIAAVLFVLPSLQGRVSIEGVAGGLTVRSDGIWDQLWDALVRSPLLGVGPGGLVAPLRSEAHNIYLRALLDFGFVVGALLIGLLLVALFRAFRSARAETDLDRRFFAALAFFMTFGMLVSGTVQDAMTAVTSTHLLMVCLGLFAASSWHAHELATTPRVALRDLGAPARR